MAEILIARTYAEGLRPLGAAAQRNHALITETLSAQLSPAHALMFSEPSPTPDGAATDWYAQIEGPVRRLDELGAEESGAARVRIGELTRDVLGLAEEFDARDTADDRRLADALRNAVEVPDADAVWLVGDQPVLVTWGHSRDIDKAPRGVIRRFIPAKPPPMPPPAPVVAVVAVERRAPWDILWWMGWLLLAVLMFWALYLLIAPCGLRGPGFLNFDSCPRAETRSGPLEAEDARRAALEGRIAALERDLALAGGACAPKAAEAESPEDVVREEGGAIGKVNVILSWDDHSDLDLSVTCPSGEKIYHGDQKACGGELDVDANLGVTMRPKAVENVVFVETPATGRYGVAVHLHNPKADRNRPHHSFTVTIIIDGRRAVHNATVSMGSRTWTTSFDYRGN